MSKAIPDNQLIEALSIDCVVFGLKHNRLHVLLVKQGSGEDKGKWSLPGGFIQYSESVDKAAYRILTAQTAISDIYLEQFHTFGEVDRMAHKRVITVAYYALVKADEYQLHAGGTASETQWTDIHEVPVMPIDHNDIFETGLRALRQRIRQEPIGFTLLPEKFTLLQLQMLYETILDIKLDKPNFRRKFLKMKLLVESNEKQKNVAHREAKLYKFDKRSYNRLIKNGFIFGI